MSLVTIRFCVSLFSLFKVNIAEDYWLSPYCVFLCILVLEVNTFTAQIFICVSSTPDSVTPLWHMMIAVSVIMYSTSYYARDYPRIKAKRALEKEALKEYYEKHGGGDDHH